MFIKAKAFRGRTLRCLDGEIGIVKGFYFDDQHWTIRYLIVDTGNWLAGRQVLISPYAIIFTDIESQYISINLTKNQIEESPSLRSDKPVSRQFEEAYNGYFGGQPYWGGPFKRGSYPNIVPDNKKLKKFIKNEKSRNPHLRSTYDVSGHDIQALDGQIGHIDDFIIDVKTWAIPCLIIDR